MLNLQDNYLLTIKTKENVRGYNITCRWNGEDFVTLKGLDITIPPIPANVALNNAVIILDIRNMS